MERMCDEPLGEFFSSNFLSEKINRKREEKGGEEEGRERKNIDYGERR